LRAEEIHHRHLREARILRRKGYRRSLREGIGVGRLISRTASWKFVFLPLISHVLLFHLKMFIDPTYRKCIAYLLWDEFKNDDQKEEHLFGTAFFMSFQCPYDTGILDAPYLITAKHGIKKFKDLGVENLVIRLNKMAGGYESFEVPISEWMIHPTLDIATLFIYDRSGLNSMDWKHLSADVETVNEQFQREEYVTEGSDVFIIGLFSNVPGGTNIQPVVRFGNISLMDYELISLPISEEPLKVYLCETRSWAGYSGSPVFAVAYSGQSSRLLGMVSGHFLAKDSLESETSPLIHAGISYVTRIEDILGFLGQDELTQKRKEFWDGIIARRAARIEMDAFDLRMAEKEVK
jgi:hypothetical protein